MKKHTISSMVFLTLLSFVAGSIVTFADAPEAEAQKRRTTTKKKKGRRVVKIRKKKNRPLLGVKGGFIFQGTGTSATTTSAGSSSATFTDDSQIAVGAFVLFPIATKGIRGGLALNLYPAWAIRPEGQTRAEEDGFGTDINLVGEYEQKFQGLNGFLFGEGGYTTVTPPKAAGDPEPDSWTGFNIGGGAGVHLRVSRGVGMRVDGKFQIFRISGSQNNIDVDVEGMRIMANAGVAFDL